MKNIHILPTDKPSRLSILNSGKLNFGAEFISSSNSKAQNIYITNSEEIKEGWHFNNAIGVNNLVYIKIEDIPSLKAIYGNKPKHLEKIILTDNKDLIKDGVQAIDDEFLEWVCSKNGKIDFVEVIEIEDEKNK